MAAISEHHIQQINEYFTCKIYPYENQPDSHPMKYPYKFFYMRYSNDAYILEANIG